MRTARSGAIVFAAAAALVTPVGARHAQAQAPTWVRADSAIVRDIRQFRGDPLNLMMIMVDGTPPGIVNADGEYQDPGARIAALKDLYNLAWLVDIYPHLRLAVTLRPSTLEAIEETVAGYDRWVSAGRPAGLMPGCDRWLRLSLTPVASLGEADRDFIAGHFFDVPVRDVFRLYPAFAKLERLRGTPPKPGAEVAAALGDSGLRDLIAWQNLAILDPDFTTQAITLQGGQRVDFQPYFAKQQGFTDADIAGICAMQMEVLRALVPQYRALAGLGRLEVVTAPFYDPVLPVMQDPAVVRMTAGTRHPIPSIDSTLARDAEAQVAMAVEQYRRLFGAAPAGIWLGSGGLEPATLAVAAKQGFTWVGADDIALRGSVTPGRPRVGERLRFALHEASAGGRRMQLIFKDPEILRDFGPTYGKEATMHGANMFVTKLFQQQSLQADHAGRFVCTVVLGTDEWRAFEKDGNPFLHNVFSQLGEVRWLRMMTPGEALREVKERNPVSRVAGSNTASRVYAQWVGTASQNNAWKQLAALRRALDAAKASGSDAARVAEAERLLRRAEGRDFFAAFAEKAPGAAEADRAFRDLVTRAYAAIGKPAPADLGARSAPPGSKSATPPGAGAATR